jgi:hypothetical protein
MVGWRKRRAFLRETMRVFLITRREIVLSIKEKEQNRIERERERVVKKIALSIK